MEQIPDAAGGAGAEGPPAAGGSSVPFDDRSLAFGTRLVETIKLAFAEPIRLFSNLPESDIGPPVLFGVIIGTIGAVFSMVWNMLFGGLATILQRAPIEDFAIGTGFMTVMLILSPALIVVGLFISAGIFHVALMLVGGANRGFGVTLRAVCYGSAPQLLGIVPICGGIVGGIWGIVLVILAFMHGHRTDAWRAILAYFLPIVLCCCLVFVTIWMFGMFGAMWR